MEDDSSYGICWVERIGRKEKEGRYEIEGLRAPRKMCKEDSTKFQNREKEEEYEIDFQ